MNSSSGTRPIASVLSERWARRPFGPAGSAILTSPFICSNFGNAHNAQVTTNLPTLIAGGGFKHGQQLAFDRDRNYPLPNLFVSMLQRLGLESDKFASSTGTMRGLEPA